MNLPPEINKNYIDKDHFSQPWDVRIKETIRPYKANA